MSVCAVVAELFDADERADGRTDRDEQRSRQTDRQAGRHDEANSLMCYGC